MALLHVVYERLLSAIHNEHAGVASEDGPVSNKGYLCSVCHSGSQHNNAAITSGAQWASVNANTHVQVRFDTAWNPATTLPADGGAGDAPDYNDTTNACTNLYCQGATLGAGGTQTLPTWANTNGCTSCHLDTTALASGSHGPHLTTTTGGGSGCADCHPRYDLVSTGTHLNGSVNFGGTIIATDIAVVVRAVARLGRGHARVERAVAEARARARRPAARAAGRARPADAREAVVRHRVTVVVGAVARLGGR